MVFSRNFYSDNPFRYNDAANHKNDPSHNRLDIPHAVIYLSYDFGRGWTFGTEIEFEHGGTGSAEELEADEFAEWEQETEKGGEVELEQFWIQKSFARWAPITSLCSSLRSIVLKARTPSCLVPGIRRVSRSGVVRKTGATRCSCWPA